MDKVVERKGYWFFVLTLLLAGCASRGPVSGSYFFYQPPTGQGNRVVKVSLLNQAVYVMEGSRPLLVAPVGVGTAAHPTPTGHFRVFRKIAEKRSGSYGFWVRGDQIVKGESPHKPSGSGWHYVGYPMPYWVEFLPGYGFHQGYVWPVPRTHGCLRLEQDAARKFFELVSVGTPVWIAQRQPEDDTLGKNLVRPQTWKEPDPPASFLISPLAFREPWRPAPSGG
ncbi:L,D-transpeptidase [Candidatus Methylacidithermus pantelleriae]|uniref:L,D-TPase catalytic domain-containing protein n=1 Tax=Candidatus Methylacidithermus pantelleriae TaxID=2744239 RepID=A0A8J2BSP9_9BACT|nr:L,D-transpeptidase [Candidatus Methylacidithermus pantelleriae]CAF0697313.1 hypothetical protein MPNT_210043 [Candidatus Methylacidithermus pantelleriae]